MRPPQRSWMLLECRVTCALPVCTHWGVCLGWVGSGGEQGMTTDEAAATFKDLMSRRKFLQDVWS
jgi:hypothetical protein